METQILIIDDAVRQLMAIVNYLDREKARIPAIYPNWDDLDTREVRDRAIRELNRAIDKLEEL